MPEEPKLEEYNIDISVYKNYREKLNNLEKRTESLRPSYRLSFFSSFVIGFLVCAIFSVDFWASIIISGFLSFYVSLFSPSDWLANIFSLGKFNANKKEIEELKRNVYQKVEPFEKATRDYYEVQLKDFFEKKLYKKRAGSAQFEEALSEFSSTIEELEKMNSAFISTHIPLRKYENYLLTRRIDHNFQASKKTEQLVSSRSFVRKFSEPPEQKKKEIIAPEKLYRRTARKIDNWEEINKKRKLTGERGEVIVVAIEQDFFESINRSDLASRVRHVSLEDGDGLGYDVLSFFENGQEKYIEVKSTTTALSSPFYLSRNELGFLKDHSENAFIYRVLVANENSEIETLSSSDILEKSEITPIQYIVKTK